MNSVRQDKTRLVLMLAVVLWLSFLAMLFLAVRLRMKPVLIVAIFDGMLALFVTMLALKGGPGR